MSNHRFMSVGRSMALAVLLLSTPASGEVAAWDQAKVTRVSKELAAATDALQETFTQSRSQNRGALLSDTYREVEYLVQMVRSEAHILVASLGDGDGREQTAWLYEVLTSHARSARYGADRLGVSPDVGERAAAVRRVLNELGPYYDPDFRMLAPDPKIEPPANR